MSDNRTIEVRWEVSDGYVGKSRPQYVEVPVNELQECGSREDVETLIESYVQDDFEQNISWYINNLDEAIREASEVTGKDYD